MPPDKRFLRLRGENLSAPVSRQITGSLESLAQLSGNCFTLADSRQVFETPTLEQPGDDTAELGVISEFRHETTDTQIRAVWYNDIGRAASLHALDGSPTAGHLDFTVENDGGQLSGVLRPLISDRAAIATVLDVGVVCTVKDSRTEEGFLLFNAARLVGVSTLYNRSIGPGHMGQEHVFMGEADEALGREVAGALLALNITPPRPINP